MKERKIVGSLKVETSLSSKVEKRKERIQIICALIGYSIIFSLLLFSPISDIVVVLYFISGIFMGVIIGISTIMLILLSEEGKDVNE